MTGIVHFMTKKELKEAVKIGDDFMIEDPNPFGGNFFMLSEMADGKRIAVTNHQKRSWFATIEKKDGKITVR